MNQEKATPPQASDQVHIGIPIPHGYPAAPRPPISASHAAPPLPPASSSSNGCAASLFASVYRNRQHYLFGSALITVHLVLLALIVIIEYGYPTFKVEGATVSVHNSFNSSSEYATAQWNIGLSFSPGKFHDLNYDGLTVLFRFIMSPDWSRTNIIAQNGWSSTTTAFNATGYTLVHRSVVGLPLQFQVLVQVRYPYMFIESICNNLSVGFLSNATLGFMEGGPISCI